MIDIYRIINLDRSHCFTFYVAVTESLMEYITLHLDSNNEVEQWYIRHNYFYCLIT